MNYYRLQVKHDIGVASIFTWATDKEAAKRTVMAAERCPASSILEVEDALQFRTTNYYGEIYPESNKGWFEHEEDGDEKGGELLFDGLELIDYDGVFELPLEIVARLRELGFTVSGGF